MEVESEMRASAATDLQAVILAGGSGSGLYPLTVQTPKSLLPVGNLPLLAYQLWALEKAGMAQVFVACEEAQADDLARFVSDHYGGRMRVDIHVVRQDTPIDSGDDTFLGTRGGAGSASALRSLRGKLHADVLVIAGDVVTTASLQDLADVHRVNSAAVTMLLQEHPDPRDKDNRKALRKLSKNVVNFFGLAQESGAGPAAGTAANNRVVLMQSAAEDDVLEVPKSLLLRHPSVQVRSDLIDGHVYILRRWVLDLLCGDAPEPSDGEDQEPAAELAAGLRGMQNLRTELLPFLINKVQPRLLHGAGGRDRAPASALEAAAARAAADVPCANVARSNMRLAAQLGARDATDMGDHVGCFALLAPAEALLCRANTLYGYAMANRKVLALPADAATPFPRTALMPNAKTSLAGPDTQISSGVIINNSVIGAHCRIESGAMLNNTIVMDHCTIGPEAGLQNAIVAANCTIDQGCHLDDVQLGAGCKVRPPGTRLKSQALLPSDFAAPRP